MLNFRAAVGHRYILLIKLRFVTELLRVKPKACMCMRVSVCVFIAALVTCKACDRTMMQIDFNAAYF